MTVGPLRPGTICLTRSSAARGTLAIRYRWPRARSTDANAATSSSSGPAGRWPSGSRRGAVISRAVDSSIVATSRRPFTLSVEPVDVRSTTMSAIPRCGATSAAPDTGTTSTARPASAKKRRVIRGKLVATRWGAAASTGRSVIARIPLSSRAATTSRQWPNSRSSSRSTGRSDSATKSHPVTPASATPSATNSVTSCARTNSASNSPPSDAVRARSPRPRTSRPASANSSRVASARRPLLGNATRSMAVG